MQEGESDSDKLLPRRYATAAGNVVYPQRNTEFNPLAKCISVIYICAQNYSTKVALQPAGFNRPMYEIIS